MVRALVLASMLVCSGGLAHAKDPHDVFGVFITQEGTTRIEITDCGDATPCGHIAWLDPQAMQPGVTPQTAKTKTGDPLLGLLMLQAFKKKTKDWRGGTIYDPRGDKTYAARLKRMASGDLQLKGCIGPICQTQIWTPYLAE